MEFEWDPAKAEANLDKHGVSFQEAVTVFEDPLSITVPDPDHSLEEVRFIIVGVSHNDRPLNGVTYGARRPHPYYQCA